MVVQLWGPSIATVMEAMDGGAFGSPVAAANVANSAIASVGEWIIRGSRIRLFQDPTELTHQSTEVWEIGTVELLGSRGNVVGTGVIDGNIKCGMELNAVKLCPSELAVRVVEVSDGSMWTWEIVGEWLGQCVGLVICCHNKAIYVNEMTVCHAKPLCKHLKIMHLIPRKKWIALLLQFPSQRVCNCQNFTPPTFCGWTNFTAWKQSAMSNPQVQKFLIRCCL
jgi:hypothetical protein